MVSIIVKWLIVFAVFIVVLGLLGIAFQNWQSRQVAKRQASLPKVARPAIVKKEAKCESSMSRIS
jgi:predicted negative regulator of RcsB-dependent stress response